ncbi:MAG TPA: UDP-N-acetylglucosamine 2-epimerase (non-hydrolyzing) [Planctomycetota bacterium]|nr:UDP-N-acetylglucosamine 2-epimerase (non-hydrolyzing) [Planctomycetota bacterium]
MADRDLVLVVLGTRPEAIKFLPVIRAFSAEPRLRLGVVTTGQHREMVEQILGPFGVKPDYDLDIMRPDQSLNDIVCGVIPRLERLYLDLAPRLVLVQGDTTSAFAAGLAAFHRRILVGHVEAGLRSYNRHHPYPEESNRRMLSAVTDLHLAATASAADNLGREGISREEIVVTGNTVIDSLLETLSRPDLLEKFRLRDLAPAPGEPLVLMTLHRRENWLRPAGGGPSPLEEVLSAVGAAAQEFPRARFVYPVHPNPNVQEPARRLLGSLPNVRLLAPLPHLPFVDLLSRSTVVLTDSGGIQEECPSLGVPVLVTRKTTERPEAVDAGFNELVGTDRDEVLAALRRRLLHPLRRPGTPPLANPYGDGRASDRIRRAVLHRLGLEERPGDFQSLELSPARSPGMRRDETVNDP